MDRPASYDARLDPQVRHEDDIVLLAVLTVLTVRAGHLIDCTSWAGAARYLSEAVCQLGGDEC